jgi:hypothetical protein
LWKRTPKKLLFDTIQLYDVKNENQSMKYYARYSQITESELYISGDNSFTKKINPVHTIGLKFTQDNTNYKIEGFTPIVIRRADKNNMPYKIDSMIFGIKSPTERIIKIESEKVILPLSGITMSQEEISKEVNLSIKISGKNLSAYQNELIVTINNKQFQAGRKSETEFYLSIPENTFKSSKNNIILELIDKSSLEKDKEYSGHTWIISSLN